MAPNPIMIPRKQSRTEQGANDTPGVPATGGLTTSILLTSLAVLLFATLSWARRWLYSGAAVESLVVIYGSAYGSRIFPSVPIWTLLASLNLIYAVASTSWLLYGLFAGACYPFILLTCLFQFHQASTFVRRRMRDLLRELHFTRDKIALFNLPALEIDTDVAGLFVVRGLTISLSSLTVVAHGIELGLKLADDIELALYADEVKIQFFRRIDIGDVYGNIKGGKLEMTFSDLDTSDADDDSIFQNDTPLLRAATAGSDGLKAPRPNVSRGLTGGVDLKDSSPRGGFESIKTLSPDDTKAEQQYYDILKNIRETSHINESRKQARSVRGEGAFRIDNDKDLRAAVCAKLQDMPSVPHPPSRSVRVTTLQNMSSPRMRRFMHRLPFLLRLLLMPLSYFHPITISSISAAGSGQWLTALLQQKVFKHYASLDHEVRRLERKVSTWLANANFCLQLTDIDGLGQVPLSTTFDVVTYLHFADIMAYRTVPNSGTIQQVVRLGGADATFTIPSFLLPHHEHLLPPRPTPADEEHQTVVIEEADGMPKTMQAEKELEKLKADETEVVMSVHASLPAWFDQSLLNFIAALVKATKVIELEKEIDESHETDYDSETPVSSPTSVDAREAAKGGFKGFAKGIRQNIKDGRTTDSINKLARDLHQSTKDGMKKAVVGGIVNDRWIAKMVGKVAAQLEQAQGDVGYSGSIPVPLEPYRPSGDLPSKFLP